MLLDLAALHRDGHARVRRLLSRGQITELLEALAPLAPSDDDERRGGVRNLLSRSEAVRDLAHAAPVRALVHAALGTEAVAVRGILFDKTPEANWKVVWHQDLTLAVRARVELPGFRNWSEKAGVTCVQAPDAILGAMLAVRVHLDPCGADDGPLRVISGSHLRGRLSPDEVARMRHDGPEVTLEADVGDALLMRPLLLHASAPAREPRHRRVVHLEFAAGPLPAPLAWFEQV